MLRIMIICYLLSPLSAFAQNLSNTNITESLKNKVRMVQHLALNPLLVKAVRKQNTQNISKEIINNRINEWNSDESKQLKQTMQSGDHVYLMKRFVDRDSTFREAFLTDQQGANVSAYPLPDRYWYGDQDIWKKSFHETNGQVYISPLEYDQNTNAIYAHVSAPVLDRTKTIGVLVVGIRLGGMQGSSR